MMSFARVRNASVATLVLSEGSGLHLARQDRMVLITCMRALARGSCGNEGVAGEPDGVAAPNERAGMEIPLQFSGINIYPQIGVKQRSRIKNNGAKSLIEPFSLLLQRHSWMEKYFKSVSRSTYYTLRQYCKFI